MHVDLTSLSRHLGLGALLDTIRERCGDYELLDHWQQGEFHHDLVIRVPAPHDAAFGPVLVVATNCNGGVKELLAFADVPDRWALWRHRCPDVDEFGDDALPPLLATARTVHWFDPCQLLGPDARSELRPECRRRARGGGWEPAA
jgi:hypothetical protein